METLIATAFGRYVNVQRGEADQLTEAASTVFRESTEGASLEPSVIMIGLCKNNSMVAHSIGHSKLYSGF